VTLSRSLLGICVVCGPPRLRTVYTPAPDRTLRRSSADTARDVAARNIAVGRSPRGPLVEFADGSLTAAVTSAAPCPVVFAQDGTPHPLTPQTLHHLRSV